jgi:hypothetical protein
MPYKKLKAFAIPLLSSVSLVVVLSLASDLGDALGATNPASEQLSSLIGTWSCTYKGLGASPMVTTTATRLDEDWLQLKGGTGGDTLVTYDAKRRVWVQFRTGLQGNYALLIAHGPATATTLRWSMVYPVNKAVGTTTISVPSTSERVIKSEYKDGGKSITSTAFCAKR